MSKLKELKVFQHITVPSNKSFGITLSIIFLVIALYPVFKGGAVTYWALIISGILFIISLSIPGILEVPNRIWTLLGYSMGRITNPLLLGIAFFLFVAPFAVILRISGKDFLRLKADKKVHSYWIDKTSSTPITKSMKNQF